MLSRIIILITTIFILTGSKSPTDEPSVQVVNFEELKQIVESDTEHTLVINFWATWCLPCVAELPVFAKLEEESAERNIRLILVSLDFANQLNDRLIPFIEKKQIRSEVVLLDDPDANRWIPLVDQEWSGAIPATWVINKNKEVFHEGSIDQEGLNKLIDEALN